MPNHCENELTISGNAATVRKVLEAIAPLEPDETGTRLGHISFDRIIPYPEEYAAKDRAYEEARAAIMLLPPEERVRRTMVEDGYNNGGYTWCCENWGTKWDAYSQGPIAPESLEGLRKVKLRFDTAWSPPKPVIIKLGQMFPEAIFRLQYWEGGACFQGKLVVCRGEVDVDECKEYHGSRGF